MWTSLYGIIGDWWWEWYRFQRRRWRSILQTTDGSGNHRQRLSEKNTAYPDSVIIVIPDNGESGQDVTHIP